MSRIELKQINRIEEFLGSTRNSIKYSFTQNNHNFEPGDAVSYFENNWILAVLDDNRLARIIVETITDQNNFIGVLEGFIEIQNWNLTAGNYYFLSETTPGLITDVEESQIFSNILLQAITSTTAHVLPWRSSKVNDSGDIIAESDREITQDSIPNQTSGNYESSGISLLGKPTNNSTVQVYVNSVAIRESYGNRLGECYFSNDNGQTARNVDEIEEGDVLYWNGEIAGYNLDNKDKVSIVYHSMDVPVNNNIDCECYLLSALQDPLLPELGVTFFYVNCEGNFDSILLSPLETIYICSITMPTAFPEDRGLIIKQEDNSLCNGCVSELTPTPTSVTPTPTPTPTLTPTITPTITPSATPFSEFFGSSDCNTLINSDIIWSGSGVRGIFTVTIDVGTGTGNTTLQFQAFTIPDKFEVFWNDNLVIDTGFRGSSDYNDQLNQLGYPNVSGTGSGSTSFNKTSQLPSQVTIIVTAPLTGTAWEATLLCPEIGPTPTPTPTSVTPTPTPTPVTPTPTPTPSAMPNPNFSYSYLNRVIKDDPGFQLESQLLITRPTNIIVIDDTTASTSTGGGSSLAENHTINVSAIGESGIVTSEATITLEIVGPSGQELFLQNTTGFLTTSFEFVANTSYSITSEVVYGTQQ